VVQYKQVGSGWKQTAGARITPYKCHDNWLWSLPWRCNRTSM